MTDPAGSSGQGEIQTDKGSDDDIDHARYGGNGVMICWHVERKNVCIYSQRKP